MPNIKLYTAKLSPPGRSVELTAKALGLELDIVPINLLAQEHLTTAFRKLNPQHTIPVIDDNGTIVWDSHAINVYLVSKYGKPEGDSLYPSDVVQRSKVNAALHFDSGVLFARFRFYLVRLLGCVVKLFVTHLKGCSYIRNQYCTTERPRHRRKRSTICTARTSC